MLENVGRESVAHSTKTQSSYVVHETEMILQKYTIFKGEERNYIQSSLWNICKHYSYIQDQL